MELAAIVISVGVLEDTLARLAFEIIRIVAWGALGVAALGLVTSLVCDLFECRHLRRRRGRVEASQSMP